MPHNETVDYLIQLVLDVQSGITTGHIDSLLDKGIAFPVAAIILASRMIANGACYKEVAEELETRGLI